MLAQGRLEHLAGCVARECGEERHLLWHLVIGKLLPQQIQDGLFLQRRSVLGRHERHWMLAAAGSARALNTRSKRFSGANRETPNR